MTKTAHPEAAAPVADLAGMTATMIVMDEASEVDLDAVDLSVTMTAMRKRIEAGESLAEVLLRGRRATTGGRTN